MLGHLHFDERIYIPEPSSYLACYYYNIASSKDTSGAATFFYSQALANLFVYRLHDGNVPIGFNVMPAAFFWLRKSRDMGDEDARKKLEAWTGDMQRSCANCGKEAQADEKFKQCSKCRAQWYCCKECQVEAWRVGHKKDCKRATIMKFEDYLNAE